MLRYVTMAQSCSFLDQSYTWSRLQICQEHFKKLFTCLRVHPDFLDIVRVFGEKIKPVEEGFNSFFVNHSDQHVRDSSSLNSSDFGYSTLLLLLLTHVC
jgi:hypothetical protein